MAAGSQMHAVTESLERGAVAADNSVAGMEAKAQQIDGVARDVRAAWFGGAPGAFDTVHAEWLTETKRHLAMLNKLGIDTRFSAAQDVMADEEGTSAIMRAMGGASGGSSSVLA